MNFLIDTNICSAYIKGNRAVWSRFLQHSGGMALSVITVGELWTRAKRRKTRPQALNAVAELIELLDVIEIDFSVALRFGELTGCLALTVAAVKFSSSTFFTGASCKPPQRWEPPKGLLSKWRSD